jgi:hypothetical protein
MKLRRVRSPSSAPYYNTDDRESDVITIGRKLKDDILAGNVKFPFSIKEMAEDYECTLMPIRDAVHKMVRDGILRVDHVGVSKDTYRKTTYYTIDRASSFKKKSKHSKLLEKFSSSELLAELSDRLIETGA